MDKAERFVAYGFIGVALVAIGGAIVVRLADMSEAHPGGGDLATWVGAIGTFLAFAGTIYISTRDARTKRLDAVMAGNLVAIEMSYVADRLRAYLEVLSNQLQLAEKGGYNFRCIPI